MRRLHSEDFSAIIALCERVYPQAKPWSTEQLASHLAVFPEGQLVAEEAATGRLLGLASSLIVRWDDYDFHAEWREWTDHGFFTNHDAANGRTLYGAEVMVDPAVQRRGVGKSLYAARRDLVSRLGLRRIRAGARLLMPAFGGGLTFCAHLVRWGARTAPLGASDAELPPCDRSALQLVHAIMNGKGKPLQERTP